MIDLDYIPGRLGVGGSNPLAPTNKIKDLGKILRLRLLAGETFPAHVGVEPPMSFVDENRRARGDRYYARMFDEKREAVLAVEKAVLPLMPARAVLAA
jgi:hypothetical protein